MRGSLLPPTLQPQRLFKICCFVPHVHRYQYHERAYFALQPVEEDSESHSLTV